jgi:hypothetical protein
LSIGAEKLKVLADTKIGTVKRKRPAAAAQD